MRYSRERGSPPASYAMMLVNKKVRWGPCIPLDLIVEVVRWGSLFLMDDFDKSLRGTRHETLTRGVMAPSARVRARG